MSQAAGTRNLITSRRNPIVARCRQLARPGHDESSEILLDGDHLVEEALRAGVTIDLAAVDARVFEARPHPPPWLQLLERHHTPIAKTTPSVIAAMSPSGDSTGVIAIAQRPQRRLPDWLDLAPQTALVAVDVQDPGNVGALIRVAHAAGFDGVIATGTTADPWAWKALRGSMGSTLHVAVVVQRDADAILEILRARGFRLLATLPRGGRAIEAADLAQPLALLVGGEGAGLPHRLLQIADARISLPMAETVESLNVAVAAGVLAYDVRRGIAAR